MGEEATIQRNIMQAAELAGCKVIRLNAGRGRYNQHLAKPGTPDLILVAPDHRVLWVEVKTKSGKLSEEQVATHMELTALGQRVIVARDVEDVMEVLR